MRVAQPACADSDIGAGSVLDRIAGLSCGENHGRLQHVDEVSKVAGHVGAAVDRAGGSGYGAAALVAHQDDQRHRVLGDGELEPAQLGAVDNVAGCSADEHIAQALIKDDLRRHTGVDATQHGYEGRLPGHERGTPLRRQVWMRGRGLYVALVPIQQLLEGGVWGHGRWLPCSNGTRSRLVPAERQPQAGGDS